MILVDSSVWIAAAKPNNPESIKLAHEIEENNIVITKIILVEVCQGSCTKEQFAELWDSFMGFKFLDVTDEIWFKSSTNYFRCRKKGLTLSTIDCLIATLAQAYDIILWTLDKVLICMNSVKVVTN
ncbi:MAG: type II toxin-antitoxin system VapC family toxin [Thermodesulfobacteriota bacterium]